MRAVELKQVSHQQWPYSLSITEGRGATHHFFEINGELYAHGNMYT